MHFKLIQILTVHTHIHLENVLSTGDYKAPMPLHYSHGKLKKLELMMITEASKKILKHELVDSNRIKTD